MTDEPRKVVAHLADGRSITCDYDPEVGAAMKRIWPAVEAHRPPTASERADMELILTWLAEQEEKYGPLADRGREPGPAL
jgi:hypothetical protein